MLRYFGAITGDQAKILLQLARIGNRAAHTYAVIAWDVEWIIGQLQEVIGD